MKKIFMPLIYGKTVKAISDDILHHYKSLLSYSDSSKMAMHCCAFWKSSYPLVSVFMRMINNIGWISSIRGKAVLYSVPFFTTSQDYLSSEKVKISTYDRELKRRRRVTVNIPKMDRDSRKTLTSTCVNMIHQMDAYIAMNIVHSFIKNKEINSVNRPIYTVHDNFITTSYHSDEIPIKYCEVFINMGNPLTLVNDFILTNLCSLPFDKYGYVEHDYKNKPIPIDYLEELLTRISKELKDMDHKKRVKLDSKKIQEIVTAYESYVNQVWGTGNNENLQWERYKKFVQIWIDKRNKGQPVYCLHY
jgi:hypothetical protein